MATGRLSSQLKATAVNKTTRKRKEKDFLDFILV
jgi:hypothetical protein